MKKIVKIGLSAVSLALPLSVSAEENLVISGAIEVEAGFADDYAGVSSSDITLATVELGLDASINERVSGHVLLLHEEDDTPLEVDEGTISVDIGNGWTMTAGQMYVPFGNYESNMVSDPLTLEIGETRESAVQLSYENDGFYGSVVTFNGDTIETSAEDKIEHIAASVGKTWEMAAYSLDVGVDYISSIGDSNNLSAALDGADADSLPDSLSSYVSGIAFHWVYNRDAISFIAEYVKSDKFQAAELAFNALGAEPSAMNIEFGYDFSWGNAAIGVQTTDEALALGLPETRTVVAASKEIYEGTSLSFEYAMDDDYAIAVGGTGKDASTITAQLAVEF